MPLTTVHGLRGLPGSARPYRRRFWRPQALAFKRVGRAPVPVFAPGVPERPREVSVCKRVSRPAGPLRAQGSQGSQSGLNGATVRWLVIALLALTVFGFFLKETPLAYILVAVGLPFAFLTPANALATLILTSLVPAAFGENNIVLYLPELLLVPLAYHALIHLNSHVPRSQRVLLLLQGIACLSMVLLALAKETPGQILDSVQVYVGPIALLLATIPLWTMSDRRFLFKVLVVAGAMVVVNTQLRFNEHGLVATDAEDRLRGKFDRMDPNYMACYIGFGLICALYLLIETLSSKQKRGMVLVWLAPIAVSLVLMGRLASRGMMLALLAGLVVLVATVSVNLPRRIVILVLVLLVGLGVAMSGGFDLLWTRFQQDDVATANSRTDINVMALRLFADRPLDEKLIGGGGSSSTRAMEWHTHNAFTEQLLDHGIVGASCFVGLFLCLGTACARTRGPIRASGLALLCFTAVASLSVSPFRYAWGWVALACILPCRQMGGPFAPGPLRRTRV